MARRMNLGPQCAKCMCSICPGLLGCKVMTGNTATYCVQDCLGEDGYMGSCSQGAMMLYEERTKGSAAI